MPISLVSESFFALGFDDGGQPNAIVVHHTQRENMFKEDIIWLHLLLAQKQFGTHVHMHTHTNTHTSVCVFMLVLII